jgi:hypothetical protein
MFQQMVPVTYYRLRLRVFHYDVSVLLIQLNESGLILDFSLDVSIIFLWVKDFPFFLDFRLLRLYKSHPILCVGLLDDSDFLFYEKRPFLIVTMLYRRKLRCWYIILLPFIVHLSFLLVQFIL